MGDAANDLKKYFQCILNDKNILNNAKLDSVHKLNFEYKMFKQWMLSIE